jgi:hypothetical protein
VSDEQFYLAIFKLKYRLQMRTFTDEEMHLAEDICTWFQDWKRDRAKQYGPRWYQQGEMS